MEMSGSQDRPLKVDFNHEWVKNSEVSDESTGVIGLYGIDPFDYPYPAGVFPNGDYFNEDPEDEFCSDNGNTPPGCGGYSYP